MDQVGRLPLGGRRYQAYTKTIRFVGVDLSSASFRMEVRMLPNTPGAPLLALGTVSTAAAEGIRLVSVEQSDGKPVSVIGIRVNKSSMEALPFSGEMGDDNAFAYDLMVNPAGQLEQVWLAGTFVAQAGVTGATNAPLTYSSGVPTSYGVDGGSSEFQVGDTIVVVELLPAQGPPGKPSGPLGAGSVGSSEISNDSTEQALVRDKIGAPDASVVDPAVENLPFAAMASRYLDASPRPIMRFPASLQAKIASGATIKIGVVGDSIKTPTLIAYANALSQMLATAFGVAAVPVSVENLSLPGRSWADLASASYTSTNVPAATATNRGTNLNYWIGGSTAGKTWRDEVRDRQFDVVAVFLGENDGNDDLPVISRFQTFYEYCQGIAGNPAWPVTPFLVLGTSLLPEGTPAERNGKQSVANFIRYKAVELGLGLIDDNVLYRLVRDGTLLQFGPWTLEEGFAGYGDPARWTTTGSPAVANGVFSGSGKIERRIAAPDIQSSFVFKRTSADSVPAINFRLREEGGWSLQVNFADQVSRLYYREILQATAPIGNIAVGGSLKVTLLAEGPVTRVWHGVNPTPVIDRYSAYGIYAGRFNVGTAQGTADISAATIEFREEFVVAAPFFDAAQLLLSDGPTLHHPTAFGASLTNELATKIFAKEFVAEAVKARSQRGLVTTGLVAGSTSNPAVGFAPVAGMSVTFTLPAAKTVLVATELAYQNPNASPAVTGRLLLSVDGSYLDGGSTYLEPTGANPRQVVRLTPVALSAGTHTIFSAWGEAAGLSSPANGRSLSVQMGG